MYKHIIINVIVFGIGATAGFFLSKKYHNSLAEKEINSVKETFKNLNPITTSEKEDQDEIKEHRNRRLKEDRFVNNGLVRAPLTNNMYEQAKQKYNITQKIVEKIDSEEQKNMTFTDEVGKTEDEMLELTKINTENPYLIEEPEFYEDFKHHDKITLFYYKLDDVLCDENEEIIDDIEQTVGYDALSKLDMQSNAWVRNESLGTDFEIISLNQSFAETVYGEIEGVSDRNQNTKRRKLYDE